MRLPIGAAMLPFAHDCMKAPRALERPKTHSYTPNTTVPPTGRGLFLIRPARFLTTPCMKTPTAHANLTKTAIGYVRVSTQEQATEGVSLDAQRDRLRSYCASNAIRLIDIVGDEGISGSTVDRPGLQAALYMIKRGRANTLIVVKLDRLSRSLRAVCALVED